MPIRLLPRVFKLVNINNELVQKLTVRVPVNCYLAPRRLSTSFDIEDTSGTDKKRKSKIIPKITLINGDQLTVTTLEEGLKLSKRRDLKLVKIIDLDTKTQRPVYKLMTGSEYHADDLKQRELKKKSKQKGDIKGEKVLIINQNISENDLQTDVRKITKWITKFYEVRIVINGDSANMDKADHVYNFLENALKSEARFLQKRQKGSDIKFQIYPPKKDKTDNSGDIL